MATIPIFEPQLVGNANNSAFNQIPYVPAQNAAWRRGDILVAATTGTTTTPSGGTGTLATFAGPTFGAPVSVSAAIAQTNTANTVTVTGVASATAPAQTYYVQLTYTGAAGAESQTGTEFIVNCAPGWLFSVNVIAATAPVNTTNYGAYVGLYPSFEQLQQATKTTTATGTAFAISFPLANNFGATRAANNVNANILGLAVNSSYADFYSGTGGSFAINEQSQFGATMNQNPLNPNELFLGYVVKLQNLQLLEISLAQQYSPLLLGSTVGISIAANGFFQADTSQSNKVFTIYNAVEGVPSIVGNGTETSGKRVIGYFNQGLI